MVEQTRTQDVFANIVNKKETAMYKVIIVKQDNKTSILNVNRKSSWDDITQARKYVREMRKLISEGFSVFGAVDAYIRDDRGAVWL